MHCDHQETCNVRAAVCTYNCNRGFASLFHQGLSWWMLNRMQQIRKLAHILAGNHNRTTIRRGDALKATWDRRLQTKRLVDDSLEILQSKKCLPLHRNVVRRIVARYTVKLRAQPLETRRVCHQIEYRARHRSGGRVRARKEGKHAFACKRFARHAGMRAVSVFIHLTCYQMRRDTAETIDSTK
jgi:hypothetical protein